MKINSPTNPYSHRKAIKSLWNPVCTNRNCARLRPSSNPKPNMQDIYGQKRTLQF